MENAKKKLYSTTMIYFISNSIITIIQFIMLKYITGAISTEDYGYYGLILSIDNIITPIFTLQIGDAIFRLFYDAKDNEEEKKKLYTNGVFILFVGIMLISLSSIFVNFVIFGIQYLPYVLLYVISTNIFVVYQKICRSLDKNKEYVIINIIKAIIYVILQIVTLFVLKWGVVSIFVSTFAATFLCILILEIRIRTYKMFNIKKINKKEMKEMIRYSLPLVPNTILWWLSSSVNMIIVSFMIGLDSNGIYVVANKFAAILTIFTNVFALSWQESSIKEYENIENTEFYNETYNSYVRVVITIVCVIIPFIQIVMPYMIDESYYNSIEYAPLLIVATGFSVISGFFGAMYGATKNTKGAMVTTLFAVIVNLTTIFVLVKIIGLWAAVFASLLGNIVIVIVRYRKFKKIMRLKNNYVILLLLLLLLEINIWAYYCWNSIINIMLFVAAIIIFFITNRKMLKDIFSVIAERTRRKK